MGTSSLAAGPLLGAALLMSLVTRRRPELQVGIGEGGCQRQLWIASVDAVLNRQEGEDEQQQGEREHGLVRVLRDRPDGVGDRAGREVAALVAAVVLRRRGLGGRDGRL